MPKLPVQLLPEGHAATAAAQAVAPTGSSIAAMHRVSSGRDGGGLTSTPSAERLAALLHRSPALSSARNLTVAGSPPGFGLSPGRLPQDGQRGLHASPLSRPSGAGGYSPPQRVILATLQGPGEEHDEPDASFTLSGSAGNASPREAVATPADATKDAAPRPWTQ